MIPKSDRNSQGSSKESRSLLVSAGRRMVGCHPMANGHGSNEPETTRTEPKGTNANQRTCKPKRGNDSGRLAGAVENRRNSNETHPEKRNSRMTDVPGGEPGSVILANSRRRTGKFRSHSKGINFTRLLNYGFLFDMSRDILQCTKKCKTTGDFARVKPIEPSHNQKQSPQSTRVSFEHDLINRHNIDTIYV